MTDLDRILPLWQELQEAGAEYVLATIVAVEGSGYRKPGARMLIAANGRRAGTISGGCLEGEVARRAFWHTEDGPVVRRYSTAADDGDVPFGMGCGGAVHLLLERSTTATPLLERLAERFEERLPLAVATVLDGDRIGQRAYFPTEASGFSELDRLAQVGFDEQRNFTGTVKLEDQDAEVWVESCSARPGLFIFGAGDDAIPVVKLARQLGWYVAVADGRSHLATRTRFPEAHAVRWMADGAWPALTLRATDAVVVMTHSLEQDTGILSAVLAESPGYIGVLGPRRRTADILLGLALRSGVSELEMERQAAEWMQRLHAPMGLDLGSETSAEIALAVIAEIQQSRLGASGRALRELRGRDDFLALTAAVAGR